MRKALSFVVLNLLLVTPAASQGKLANFEDFATDSGRCGQSDLDQLKKFQEGFTFTVKPAEILSDNGISPRKVADAPPLTSFTCHGKSRNRDLWLVSRSEDPAYCGWVRSNSLLKSKSKRASKQGIFSGSSQGEGICGDIAPLTVAEYCAAMKAIDSNVEACDDPRIGRSSINAKFLVWNAALTQEERAVNPLEVKIYTMADAATARGAVNLFSVLRIFDIARNDRGTFFLVGSSHRNMLGWVKEDSGTVWYTVLSTFFQVNEETEIRSDEPRIADATTIAHPPKNLAEMLKGQKEFPRYPVLFDRRKPPKKEERNWAPYLEIAFIGRFCDRRLLCAGELGDSRADLPVEINKSDVMFLIDATKSMRNYFGLVADAVNSVAAEYVGSPDFQFGAAMYGDHLSKAKMGLNDPIQYKEPITLRPLTHGDEFASLRNEALYILDPVGELEEAPYAALAKVVRGTPWRGDIPRFVIHLADHGDRRPVPQELLELLKRERIFYIPIAVRGDYNESANVAFLKQTQDILKRHVTETGQTIGLPNTLATYGARGALASAGSEYDTTASADRAGISLSGEIKRLVMEKLLKLPQTRRGGDENLLPAGYAQLTTAAMEMYGIKVGDVGNAAQGTIATKGYVKTAPLTAEQDRWNYYAAVSPGDISQLKSGFEVLCKTAYQTDSADRFVESLEKILSILTGDTFESKDRFHAYFKDRDTIPLSSRTILGDGLIELGRRLSDPTGGPRVKALQKEACRTAVLLQRIDGRQRLGAPFERKVIDGRPVKGDLEWDDRAGIYHYKNAQQHDWVYEDVFATRTIFVPLDYLPGPAKAIR